MSVKVVMKVLHNAEADYVKKLEDEIARAVGKIDHIELWGQEILVAAYVTSPYIGATSLLKGKKDQEEDRWQSKSFMVLAIGDKVEKAAREQGKKVPQVGHWYWGSVQEHFQLNIRGIGAAGERDPKEAANFLRPWGDGGWPCRTVLLSDIKGSCGARPQDIV